MKKRFKNNNCVPPKIIMALCLLIFFPVSCNSKKERGLIPEKIFAAIVSEIHLADGLVNLPDIHDKYYQRDTLANYTDIVENHGYTQEAMDKTLKYYFTKKPKRLIKIYDHAIGQLTEIETFLMEEIDEEITQQGGLWKGSPVYYLSGISDTTKIYFDHIFYTPGEYKLEFSATVFPSDQSFNPSFTAYTCSADSIVTGKRNFINGIEYLKDGLPHTYTYIFRIQGRLPLVLKGWLYDHENNPGGIYKHAKIENISFSLTSGVI